MSNTRIRMCEKCGVEAREDKEPELFKGFASVDLCFNRYSSINGTNMYRDFEIRNGSLDLCPGCLAKLGITTKELAVTEIPQLSPAETLYDLITQIVQDCNEQLRLQ